MVGYPTIESANFGQEIECRHDGRNFLEWHSHTWLLDQDSGAKVRPLATELGFWRPSEDGREIELLLAHPTGIVEMYYGTIEAARVTLRNRQRRAQPAGQGVQRRVTALRAGRVAAVLGHGHGRGGAGAAEPRLRAAEAGGLRHDVSDLAEVLRARGMRLTPQRRRIVAALTELEHGTPDAVVARVAADGGPALPPSTIYRALEALEDLGVVSTPTSTTGRRRTTSPTTRPTSTWSASAAGPCPRRRSRWPPSWRGMSGRHGL